ncbi:MAG: hypothetical protein HKO59_08475 [Phycisphaerales bacterium]|nr:hypothetical protein [Phycisphaerae bacterium]NNF42037.1 hypothetical protein [Phycisphaerales bacterium]NNM26005.1 hypothetical protein [Phycisphaerales bacterium]
MRRRLRCIVLVGLALVTAGCQRSLFPDKSTRTQFDTYDLVRQRYVPTEEPDVFGKPRPALRARLSQSR